MKSSTYSAIKIVKSILLISIVYTSNVDGFYVPGVAPQDFSKGDNVEVKVKFSFHPLFTIIAI